MPPKQKKIMSVATRRRVVYSVAMSLDGYIAREDGGYEWIPNEPTIDWGGFMRRFDTVLMGRKTYEVAQGQGGGAGGGGPRTIVFSRSLKPADHPDVTIAVGDPAQVLAPVRNQPGKDIWLMGGGHLFRQLLDAGQVDVVEIGLVPVLLGGGIPLLPAGGASVRLRLAQTRPTGESGIQMLTYETVRSPADYSPDGRGSCHFE
jgi:dihydrofolate reductase